ncbi:PhzF family phenazine biosynthesis protein [Rivibacter subsaxonicus]|uniref:PhzF family phenazine biosynthesis protein n=1 Tax=Rivibacter subsaxonicus TaxID=457575 RepID=A0A4Q7VW78_9BURK|nr:PhzF family phenazine biosynthesis protein [Rivibacter subsaxonicus]RZU00698.1 PhzF family phenazine biosynthesis protein [Rivibacter subsaxonicus]
MDRRFLQLDVFAGATALSGNPLAVVVDAAGIDDAQMAAFARWTNLSETTFLLPPSDPAADYRVRIFTPAGELPFAGHPTLGSCHAWLASGGMPKAAGVVVQECGVGLVRVRADERTSGGSDARRALAFAAPPLKRSGPLDETLLGQIAQALGVARAEIVDHQWADNGPGWAAVMLGSASQALALKPDFSAVPTLKLGVIAPQAAGHDADFEVRAFFPAGGHHFEDPVTGSLNAGLAQWLIGAGLAPARYVAAQGAALRRAGRVRVEQQGADIWIGGDVVTHVRGTLDAW